MIIQTLVETGWIGLLAFLSIVVLYCGFGGWRFTPRNSLLFAAVFLPVVLITIGSHSLFLKRYFCVYMVNLMLVTRVMFRAKEMRR